MTGPGFATNGLEELPPRVALLETSGSPLGPLPPPERIELLDVLRGLALFGILQVNFGSNYYGENVLGYLGRFAFDGSFYPFFSFLFGLGFAIQLIRAEERRRPFVLRYLWRLLLLFLIGTAHYAFLWGGDILRIYALMGAVLLLFLKWRPLLLIGAAAVVLLFSVAPAPVDPNPGGPFTVRMDPERVVEAREALLLASSTRELSWYDAGPARMLARLDRDYPAWVAGGAQDVVRAVSQRAYRLDFFREYADVLFMFLIGFYAGRRRIFNSPQGHRRLLLVVLATGFVLGMAGNTADLFGDWMAGQGLVVPELFERWQLPFRTGNLGLAFAYMSGATLLFTYSERGKRFLSPLRHVGRMALTNYLVQSAVLATLAGAGSSLVFESWLLPDSLRDGWRFLLLQAVFVAQILYSRWWFTRYRFGPVEWAWRSLTWRRPQPMRSTVVAHSGET